MKMKIYVASSWSNMYYPGVVEALRADGHEVYDFRDASGFSWDLIDPEWRRWNAKAYLAALNHPRAVSGFQQDMQALRACDACVYVMPCGVSASLEAGWAQGAGKRVLVYVPYLRDIDLMINMAELITTNLDDIRLQLCVPPTFKRSA